MTTGPNRESRRSRPSLVVGVGAAIGAEAELAALFAAMPPDAGIAFIVVRRGSFGYDLLRDAVGAASRLRVTPVESTVSIDADRVYLAPPNAVVRARDGSLAVDDRKPRSGDGPIDALLCSLAEAYGPGAVGILLSGTSTDGTLGLKAIQQACGLTLVQSPASCRYDAMPLSALAAGAADDARAVPEMPASLLVYAERLASQEPLEGAAIERISAAMPRFAGVLGEVTRHGLASSDWQRLAPHLARRMRLTGARSAEAYADLVERDGAEAGALRRELGDASRAFFRESSDLLGSHGGTLLAGLLRDRADGDGIRVWVPRCGDGEEASSLAMVIRDHLDGLHPEPPVQVFGIDTDHQAVQLAKRGVYRRASTDGFSDARRRRYFARADDTVEVRQEIRRMCRFSVGDFLAESDAAHMDLVYTRDLLAETPAAEVDRVLGALHSGLRPGGYLILDANGSDAPEALFEASDERRQIWRRSPAPGEGRDGQRSHLVSFNADLSDANSALDAERDGLEDFLNGAEIACVFLDEHEVVRRFTPAAAEIYNLIPSDVGRRLTDLTHRGVDMPPLPRLEALVEGSEVPEDEIRTDDGRWYLRRVHPSLSRDATAAGMVVTFYDVTELKQAELALRLKTEELAEADRRKDEFLGILGHELRNPVAALDAGVRVLGSVKAAPKERRWARKMLREQVGQLARLVDDLLDLTRVSQGRMRLRRRRADLAEIARRSAGAALPSIEERGHTLRISIEPEKIETMADATRIEQAIVNLLTNAAKYTPRGGQIDLIVRTAQDEVEIAVRDTGVGLTRESRKMIFEPFAQIRRGGVARAGLGIGLTLVRRIVELHGGRVDAHSAGPARGSTFFLRLPLEAPREADGPSTPPAAEHRVPDGMRLLVVDDNVNAGRGLAILLQSAGAEVTTADTGVEALEAVRANAPDVVLLDIGLPDISGYEVASTLRSGPLGQKLRIFGVTGFGTEEARRRSREAGFDRVFVKPVDLDALLEVLEGLETERD